MWRRRLRATLLALALLPGACSEARDDTVAGGEADPAPEAVEPPRGETVTLLDSGVPLASANDPGWGYSQRAAADLDGDGVVEEVVLMARVELYQGRPAWDDGQVWQVYVEEPSGQRTHLFARFVQLGTVTMRIGAAQASDPATVVLLEQLPDRLSLHEIAYRGPGEVDLIRSFERDLDPTGDISSPRLP